MSLNDLKQRILDEIPIVDVVSSYMHVSRKGTANVSLCPFHGDKNPSMHINNDKKIFKCFACGEGGNAIDFVMKYKKLEFVEALKEIANGHGINFEDYIERKKKSPKLLMAEKVLQKSAELYKKLARTGKFEKYEEFLEKRSLSKEIADTYGLGYAPKNNSLYEYLKSIPTEKDRQFALEIAFEIGLIKQDRNDPNAYYDTFRDRITFPIWDQFGSVIGYTSRAVFDYQKAKYMNSKESFVFNKRNILYGLHLAKSHIREKDAVILVEGNMDQIALFNKGFKNTVAVQGVALGDYSLKILNSVTKNFFLALDSDTAGFNAAKRMNEQCLAQGVIPKYLSFEPHKDPDEYLQNEGVVAMQKKIDEAIPFIDTLFESLLPKEIPTLIDRQFALLEECFQIVAPLRNSLEATERLAIWAKRIGLQSDSSQIVKRYEDFLSNSKGLNRKPVLAPETEEAPPIELDQSFEPYMDYEQLPPEAYADGQIDLVSNSTVALSKVEAILLQELVQHPECSTRDLALQLLDFVGSDEVKRYILRLREIVYEIDEREYVSILRSLNEKENYSQEMKAIIAKGLQNYREIPLDENTADKMLLEIEKRLKIDSLRLKRKEVLARKDHCQTAEEMNQLMIELKEIDKELHKTKSLKPKLKV
ncbi:DNA primase [Halobacteriovorax sp. GB3]|uniref:DNA primase n=1 Tax=Halobacteriovorax sp. GB3 TaxID=2719615 RepID=UPI00235F202C|nr:DNA primase [Halobacteriovorax sp. GB3]MDD0852574.1 DNA primase [Halobacteriovorax sp. GB3]